MSWSEQVRLYYDITFSMLMSIIWTIATAIVFFKDMNFSIFVFILITVLISKYLLKKGKKINFSIIVALIPAIIYEIFSQEIMIAILDLMFIVIISSILIKEINENINYDRYKNILVKGVSYIFIAAVVCGIIKPQYANFVFRGSVIYLILLVITMREAMGYCYNIKSSKVNKGINLSLVIVALLTTQNFFYNICVRIVKLLHSGFNFIMELIIDIITKIIEYPMMWAINALNKLFAERGADIESIILNLRNNTQNPSKFNKVNMETVKASPVFIFIMKTILMIVLILLIIKIVKKILDGTNFNEGKGYVEVVEDIEQKDPSYRKFINKIKKVFRKKGTPKEEVLYKYSEFVEVADKREIFKTYMTPKQLGNIVKIKVDNCNEVDEVTNIYNEAKFSTHIINREYAQKVEKYVDNINKKIK